jgi:kynurenine formamidase
VTDLLDLTMAVRSGMPVLPAHAHTCLYLTSSHEEMAALGWPSTFAVEGLLMSTHEGTHVDVPYHCDPAGPTVTDLPLSAFTGPGTCLDLTGVPASDLIDLAALERAAAAGGATVRPGDHVLLHTGHHERSYGTRDWFRHTGLSEAGSRWLAEHGVAGVGIDAPSVDSSRETRRGVYPAHQVLLVEHRVPLVENLVGLGRVAGRRFRYTGFPLRLDGCGGAPIRAVAEIGVT